MRATNTAHPELFEASHAGTLRARALDAPILVRRRGPETSRAAANSMRTAARGQRAQILAFIEQRGSHGATLDEVEMQLGIRIQSVCPAVNSLAKTGVVRDSGEKRKTRSGRDAIVWIGGGAR